MRYCLITFCLLFPLLSCKNEIRGTPSAKVLHSTYHAKALKLDVRYTQEINFTVIGANFSIKQKRAFLRVDDPVLNIERHQETLLSELGVLTRNFIYANPASNVTGRHVYLTFADGKSCSFIWAMKHADDRITRARIEHEKYHALHRLLPMNIPALSARIKRKGFNIDLNDYDEELSATVVEILSLHLLGVSLEHISGSDLKEQARNILATNRIEQTTADHTDTLL